MTDTHRFLVLMAISVVVLCAVIWGVAPRHSRKNAAAVTLIAAIISAGGMTFAKYGAGHGWPVALYYGVPAAATILLPPLYFQMPLRRAAVYVVLAFLSAPAIHFGALFLLGWNNYMPFLNPGA